MGALANVSRYSSFVPTSVLTPLKQVLEMLGRGGEREMHRVPLVDANGHLALPKKATLGLRSRYRSYLRHLFWMKDMVFSFKNRC